MKSRNRKGWRRTVTREEYREILASRPDDDPELRSLYMAVIDYPVVPVGVDNIVPDPDHPRKFFDPRHIRRLAWSFASVGQLQAIVLRRCELSGDLYILSGEYRWRAAIFSGLDFLFAVIYEKPLSFAARFEFQLFANEHRLLRCPERSLFYPGSHRPYHEPPVPLEFQESIAPCPIIPTMQF